MSNTADVGYMIECLAPAPASRVRLDARRPARLWQVLMSWRERRLLRRRLHGLELRLLIDMGLDPAEVYDAFSGSVGEVHGDRFRGFDLHEATAGK